MPVRKSSAVWTGGLKDGSGTMGLGSGAYQGAYSFGSRFEEAKGTNPEELIAAAHAGCFSMALAGALGRAGFQPQRVETEAKCHLEKAESGFKITRMELVTTAQVPGIDPAKFQEIANGAKESCPVSGALRALDIQLDARLA